MTRTLFILAYCLSLLNCTIKERAQNIDYVKVVVLGSTDSITLLNKGIGLNDYAYFDLQNDSVTLRLKENGDSNIYRTYVGNLSRPYMDSLMELITLLKRYPDGIIYYPIPDGSAYCGPTFDVEFRDSDGVHYHVFTLNGNDTLERFSHFFYHFENLPWRKQLADKNIINGDSIAVKAAMRSGYYDQVDTPYIPVSCEMGIDETKVFGVWRTVSTRYQLDKNTFNKMTLLEDGTIYSEQIVRGVSTWKKKATFSINTGDSTFIIRANGRQFKYPIVRLMENCFEYKVNGSLIRYDRL